MAGLRERLERNNGFAPGMSPRERAKERTAEVKSDARKAVSNAQPGKYQDLKDQVQQKVISFYNTRGEEITGDVSMRQGITDKIYEYLEDSDIILPRMEEIRLAREILDDMIGFGPLEPLIHDPKVSEIMVNGPGNIYVERNGRLELTDAVFRDNDHVLRIINRIVTPLGRRCDESSPMVDARLPDGSRVNAVIPPVALNGPSITIRKFSSVPLTIHDLINFNSLSIHMASFLEACVKGRCNIVVSGGTGSGKTTLLNVLSGYIPGSERIVTIEDAAELQLMKDHLVSLECRPDNSEGRGGITIRDLVINSLRMRPDRIVVGEVRGGETLDMLQAMNTGHDGSLTTAHANSPRDLIGRLETMVMMAGMELPLKAIREQIAAGVDIIIQQSRLKDGSRKITNITEVIGMEGETVVTQDIFKYVSEGMDAGGKLKGRFQSSGLRPRILSKLSANGVVISDNWFLGG